MTRTRSQDRERTAAVRRYRESVGDSCEIGSLERRLKRPLFDREDAEWIRRNRSFSYETHHILGRGNDPLYECRANLITVAAPIHRWMEGHRPAAAIILSLYVKWHKFTSRRAVGLIESGEQADWNPEALGQLVIHDGLEVHIFMQSQKVRGTLYFGLAAELLKAIEQKPEASDVL